MQLINFIKDKTNLPEKGIQHTIELLNEDCTLPFIARYRKERTGNLDEVEISDIIKFKEQFEELTKRKLSILKSLEEQGVLTIELKQKITQAETQTLLEDVYLPYKKKRKTKAETARKNGLEPLAKIIMSQKANDLESIAYKYKNSEVSSVDDALEGARFIIAEWLNERMDIRSNIRRQLERNATIICKGVKSKITDEKAQKFRDYFDWSESLNRCPSHRFLAILRAENEGFIRVKIEIDHDSAFAKIENRVVRSNNACSDQITIAIEDSYKRLLFPALSNEVLKLAKEKADASAIDVFAKNLKQLLLGAPLGEKRVLAIDPGFRTGCKVVCLDAQGGIEYNETIYPHAPKNDSIGAIRKINSLVDAYKIEAIAIGNGTASRETEGLVRKIKFNRNVQVFVVSEAGASIYSASKIARDEFPNYDITVRGAISIGRRLADPLAELVKIDPKSIGVGQYQHDVDQTKLKSSLDVVVASCVNSIGVNINTASTSLLSYVSGIGPKIAENIVAYRTLQGGFKTRSEIKKVPRLGAKAFEQSGGFLRIKNGTNQLDNSSVHPERYALIKKMAAKEKIDLEDLIGNSTKLKQINLQSYCTNEVGLPTLQDIVKELEKPGLDPREIAKVFAFHKDIRTIGDLREGQLLPGIVNNITNFGCFVDIGIKESGLVHVSNLSDSFVSDVNAAVNLHQQVIVKVLEVDVARKRIQLSMNY
jgi:uncharacterized protein